MRAWNGERERVGGWGENGERRKKYEGESSGGSSSDLIRNIPLWALGAQGSGTLVGLLTTSRSVCPPSPPPNTNLAWQPSLTKSRPHTPERRPV